MSTQSYDASSALGVERPWLQAVSLTVNSPKRGRGPSTNRCILNAVSAELHSGELVAILGPSGSGKSTLLRLLAGRASADEGRVILHNLPAGQGKRPDAALAYLDQDDILHSELSLRRALGLTAELRQPHRPRQAVMQAVDAAMTRTNLLARRHVQMDRLSGGERRRANLCAELLSGFAFLFLDEPTASLDPHHSREMLKLVRGIASCSPARPGVVVVTHDVWNDDLFDRVIFLVDGYLIFCGSPQDLHAYFRAASLREIYARFEKHNDEHRRLLLAQRASSRWQRWSSTHRSPPVLSHPPGAARIRSLEAAGNGLAAGLRQFNVLVTRLACHLISGRLLAMLCCAQPLVFAALVIALSDRNSLVAPVAFGLAAKKVLFTLIMLAVLMGLINSHREIVRERRIFRQEQICGLTPGVYLLSKLAFLAALSLGQVLLMLSVALQGLALPQESLIGSTTTEMILSLALCSVANTALGLLLSALAGTSRQATLLLVPLIAIEMALGGLLFELEGWTVILAKLMPALWTYRAMGTIINVNQLSPFLDQTDPQFLYDSAHLWRSWAMLAALTVGYGALAWLALEFQRLRRRSRSLIAIGASP